LSGSGPVVDEYRLVMGHFLTGVTIVTGTSADRPLGFTCQSFTSVSLEPRLVTIVPSLISTSWPGIETSGRFCVNVLAAGQADLARRFAVSGGEKFDGVAWSPCRSGNPVIEGHLAFVDCEIRAVHPAGDHVVVIGEVVELGLGPATVAGPLHYYRGRFFDPGEPLHLSQVGTG
jgi:3-hydroxy-9,10-secoandrosta-1,3,5(10)-triene-9,17-dione monooxygenase reductase component